MPQPADLGVLVAHLLLLFVASTADQHHRQVGLGLLDLPEQLEWPLDEGVHVLVFVQVG